MKLDEFAALDVGSLVSYAFPDGSREILGRVKAISAAMRLFRDGDLRGEVFIKWADGYGAWQSGYVCTENEFKVVQP